MSMAMNVGTSTSTQFEILNTAREIYLRTHVCMRVHVHVCACVHVHVHTGVHVSCW